MQENKLTKSHKYAPIISQITTSISQTLSLASLDSITQQLLSVLPYIESKGKTPLFWFFTLSAYWPSVLYKNKQTLMHVCAMRRNISIETVMKRKTKWWIQSANPTEQKAFKVLWFLILKRKGINLCPSIFSVISCVICESSVYWLSCIPRSKISLMLM